jgi:two-component system, LytTR family, response regulator
MAIRVLIVDDEPLARKKVRTFLKEHADVEVEAECSSGLEASNLILALRPDLLFLDIRIPDRDGFEVLKSVESERLPAVIFTTAFDEYAVKAFEVNAIDYLLKPFNRQRFADAITRFRARWKLNQGAERNRFLDWLRSGGCGGAARDRLVVKSGGRILLIAVGSVRWIGAEGDYVRIHLSKQNYLMRETLQSLARRLDPKKFTRIHRSTIVNVEFVTGFKPLAGGDYRVFLQDGTELTLSRTFRRQIARVSQKNA